MKKDLNYTYTPMQRTVHPSSNLIIKLILFVVSNGVRFVPKNRRTLDTLRVLESRELSECLVEVSQ
jgi:hypothetical protein